MKNIFLTIIAGIVVFSIETCSTEPERINNDEWNDLPDNVVSGGVQKDGIPALTSPEKVGVQRGKWLPDSSFVVGMVIDGQAVAYPHAILDHHEIINEPGGATPYTLSFCPLTGSAVAFETTHAKGILTFGVSGLLLQNNLIMYDRVTDSYWPQLRLQCDKGELKNTKLNLLPTFEMKWRDWKRLHPKTLVLSENTGYRRNYALVTLYANYRVPYTPPAFPMKHSDSRIQPKRRVLGVYIDDSSKAYPLHFFPAQRNILNDVIDGVPVVVYSDKKAKFLGAFVREIDGQTLTFTLDAGMQTGTIDDVVFTDEETGSTWNVKGEALSGPLAGKQLDTPDYLIAYWFAWSAFNRDTQLWEG